MTDIDAHDALPTLASYEAANAGTPVPASAGGRPTLYTVELGLTICRRLADGESLRKICKSKGLPDKSTVFDWVMRHREFGDAYLLARALQFDGWAEDVLEIADDSSHDYIATELGDGVMAARVDHEHIARSRLRVDSRKWLLSKLLPKKYGDRLALEAPQPTKAPDDANVIDNDPLADALAAWRGKYE